MHNNTINMSKITQYMSKRTRLTKKDKQNCLFCDSSRHRTAQCTSTMKGNMSKIYNIWSVESPDFNSYTLKELKYISFYNQYEKSLESSDGMGDQNLNTKYGWNPISLTLSKTRMVKALNERWKIRRPLLEKYYDKPQDIDNECPICYNAIQTQYFNYRDSTWISNFNIGTIKTTCNHHFCGDCWDKVKHVNTCKQCPLCRSQVSEWDTRIYIKN